jgi:hypothetical protein
VSPGPYTTVEENAARLEQIDYELGLDTLTVEGREALLAERAAVELWLASWRDTRSDAETPGGEPA